MANRILLGNSTFKVSKPGYNVLTTTAPQELMFDMNGLATFGSYATGQINPYSIGYRWTLSNLGLMAGVCRVPIPNSGGYIPMVVVQQVNWDGLYALGPHYEVSSFVVSSMDELGYNPPRENDFLSDRAYVEDGNYFYTSHEKYSFLFWGVETSAIEIATSEPTHIIRYHAFLVRASNAVYAALDSTPTPFNFPDNSSASQLSQTGPYTVSGLGSGVTAVMKVSTSLPGSASQVHYIECRVVRSGTTYVFGPEPGHDFFYADWKNGDQVSFMFYDTAFTSNKSCTFTVENVTSENTYTFDTFTLTTALADRDPDPVNWSNVSAAYNGSTNSQTITGVNGNVALRLEFNPAYTGQVGFNGANTSHTNATQGTTVLVYNTYGVTWSFYPSAAYSGTVTVRNESMNTILDTFTVNITVPPGSLNVIWSDISASAFAFNGNFTTAQGMTDVQTLSGFTGTKTITVNLSQDGYSVFRIHRNNSIIQSHTSGTTFQFTVSPGDSVYFSCDLSSTGGTYMGACYITDGSPSTSEFSIYLEVSNYDENENPI